MERRFFVPVLLGLAFIIASALSAQAAPKGSKLHGEYSMIGTRTCIQPNLGKDFILVPPNYSLPSEWGGTTRTTHYNGILELEGNGTGKLSAKALQINHNAQNLPIGGFIDECDVTYNGLEDGTIQMGIANCLSENTFPPTIAGSVFSFTPYPLSVTVSANGDTLLLSDLEPVVETVWTCGIYPSGEPKCTEIINPQKRICARSFTAIRLSPRP